MLSEIRSYLLGRPYRLDQEEITRQNRLAIRYLAMAGIPLSIVNIAAQLIIKGVPGLSGQSFWMLGYFVVLNVLDRFVIPRKCRRATLLAYLLEAPIMLVSIFLGTIWDPTHQALTYMMFMVVMPAFILDIPLRVMGVLLGWNALFMGLVLLVKAPDTWRPDFFHMLEFQLASYAVTVVVLKLRFEVLRSYLQIQYHFDYDALTGLRSRKSLEKHLEDFTGRRIFVAIGDLDHLALYNDFYGQEFGDEILRRFSGVVQEVFGKDQSFRYGGDELLCLASEEDEQQCLARIRNCREKLEALRFSEKPAHITCAFGYVTGTPDSPEKLEEMIRLADIYAHKAHRLSQSGTVGGAFNEEALRAGIVESNMSNHTRAYEVNQVTGLPAMNFFIDRSEELLAGVAHLERQPVVGYFNLVRFHEFNETFGYSQGDALIRFTAEQLRALLPRRQIAYVSGGRFALLCYLNEVEPAMESISRALAEYKAGYPVCCKAGFAAWVPGSTVISLLDKARLAHDSIYRRKGRCFRMFDEELEASSRLRQHIVSHLDQAIREGWIQLHYHPIIRSMTGEVCNREALSRWQDPEYGLLMPGQFIAPLEEERIIYKLSLHVVAQVLRDFRTLEAAGMPLVPVSVNLSRCDFQECDMVEAITALVDASGYPRDLLCLEITESAYVEHPEILTREVDRFRTAGFQVWMDDFGSEYSTLNLLQDMSFDLIKIDMRFMKNLVRGSRNAIIVSDVISMCKRLGVTTLVEGVETLEHLEILRRMGCEKLQGFLFMRPCPLQEVVENAREPMGLRTELRDAVDYYAILGRVDLDAPLTQERTAEGFPFAVLPAGIVESRGGALKLLRGNEAFYAVLELLGAAGAKPRDGVRLTFAAPPAVFLETAARCGEDSGWHSCRLRDGRREYTLWLRFLARRGDAAALLVAVFPGEDVPA